MDGTVTESESRNNGTSLAGLLERVGVHIRGRRGDCPRCHTDGRNRWRGSIAFNDEVFLCHLCGWTGNIRTLSRQLGMSLPPERAEDVARRERETEFDNCRNECWMLLADRLNYLTRRAEKAKTLLRIFPDNEPAWEALAEYCHREREIFAALDMLSFEKCSPWLERAMTREVLFALFNQVAEANRAA